MMLNYPEARMTVPLSAITRIGGEFVLKIITIVIVVTRLTIVNNTELL